MVSPSHKTPKFAEFFCGGGLVRAGLGADWDCAFANDIDPMKCAVYAENWGGAQLHEGDIAAVSIDPLLHPIDLYWASSPCQDFSLAGKGQGLAGARSGVFREWVRLIGAAVERGVAPRVIAFENVVGLLTRNAGRDFREVLKALMNLGYRVGALEIDAAHFVPQSRPRVFIVGVQNDVMLGDLETRKSSGPFHSTKIKTFVSKLPRSVARNWIWWRHDAPNEQRPSLADVVDTKPNTAWHTGKEVSKLLSLMSEPSRGRVARARISGQDEIGMLYKRGRPDTGGVNRQRAEIRFDGLAGCLRTPAGGSSRQTIMLIKGNETRARLLSSTEVARLMGLPDSYRMPQTYNQAYKVAGDGVAVPVVAYLNETLFMPLLRADVRRAVA